MRKCVELLFIAAIIALPATAWGQASPSDFTSATRYDAEHRITGTIAPDPDGAGALKHLAVRNTYDAAGRLVKVEKGELSSWQSEAVAPANWSGFSIQETLDTEYDLLDRKTKESVSSGGVVYKVTQYSYDLVGRLECTAVRMNAALFGSLPASACVHSQGAGVQDPDRITRNFYDDAGQLMQVRKAVGVPGLEQAYVTYGYTPNGKQEYVVDANGNKARMLYDGHDRQVQWQFPSAAMPSGFDGSNWQTALATAGAVNAADFEAYEYDANGNRTALRKRDGRVLGFSYDALDRVSVKAVPDACVGGYACTNVGGAATRDVYYSYDAWGRQTAARFDGPGGADAVTSGYDGFGRLIASTTSMGGVSRTLSYGYDADGNRTTVTYPDGVSIQTHYDGLNRVSDTLVAGADGLIQARYDSAGRRAKLYRMLPGSWGAPTSYGYDGISRLTSLAHQFASAGHNVTATFGYNRASQIAGRTRDNDAYAFSGYANVSRSYVPNGLNQYASAGGVGFGYDSNGNLTASGDISYTYDAENRLVLSSTGTSLSYDPLGRLYEVFRPSIGATRFLYDGDQLATEYDESGNLLRRYAHGPGDDDPYVWFEGPGTTAGSRKYLFGDHQGSVIALADGDGAVTEINSYDEYGIPSGANVGRFQYTGQAWIPELGMYHYKARIYSPTLGRFLQTDPIGYDDQVNLYAYVANDPVNGRDPTGEDKVTCTTVDGKLTGCTVEQDDSRDTQVIVERVESYEFDGNTYYRHRGSSSTTVEGSITRAGWGSWLTTGRGQNAILADISSFVGEQIGNSDLQLGFSSETVGPNVTGPNAPTVGMAGGGRPGANTVQNGQVTDAARAEGLSAEQRRQLGRAVEAESRRGGANLGYHEIREIAREIKSGRY